MAGEKKGKTYEALFYIALEHVNYQKNLNYSIFWNEKPSVMTIEPDLTLGKTSENPEYVFLITHSGAITNSNMKFWRNIGELAEAKVFLPNAPKVFTILFDSDIKKDIKEIQAASFDGQLIVGDKHYGLILRDWVNRYANELPADKERKIEAIKVLLNDDTKILNAIKLMASDIAKIIESDRPELNLLWEFERNRKAGTYPETVNQTYLRRGIGKLLILGPPYSSAVDQKGNIRKGVSKEILLALETLKLARRTIAGFRIIDPEILWVIKTIDKDLIDSVCQSQPVERMNEWIDPLIALPAIPNQIEYISRFWNELLTPLGLYTHLKDCHNNPFSIAPDLIPVSSKRVWLFHVLIDWIKICNSKKASYGIHQLLADLRKLAKSAEHIKNVETIIGNKISWRSVETLRLGLQDWHSSPSKQSFPLFDEDVARIADALVLRLTNCQPPTPQDKSLIVDAVIQSNLERKLLTYSSFSPLESLIRIPAEKYGLVIDESMTQEACFAQLATYLGSRIDKRSGGTTLIKVNQTLINWQTATEAGRDHKKKELCGRAVALRYSWNSQDKQFIPRLDVKKLMLVLDGNWREEDFSSLVKAGWDNIFYPNQIQQLLLEII